MLENPWSAVGNPISALGPSGSSFSPSSLAPVGIHHLLLSNLTTGHPEWPSRKHATVLYGMVWYGNSAIITKVSNALDTLVSGEKPGFQTLSEGLVVLLCAEVVRQRVPDHGAVHSECSASDSG